MKWNRTRADPTTVGILPQKVGGKEKIVKSLHLHGTEHWYMDRGDGVPLVLIHGFPLDHTMWDGQVAGLAHESGELLVGEAFLPVQGQAKGPRAGLSGHRARIYEGSAEADFKQT